MYHCILYVYIMQPDPDKMARKKEQHMFHHAVHEDSADCPFYESIDLVCTYVCAYYILYVCSAWLLCLFIVQTKL